MDSSQITPKKNSKQEFLGEPKIFKYMDQVRINTYGRFKSPKKTNTRWISRSTPAKKNARAITVDVKCKEYTKSISLMFSPENNNSSGLKKDLYSPLHYQEFGENELNTISSGWFTVKPSENKYRVRKDEKALDLPSQNSIKDNNSIRKKRSYPRKKTNRAIKKCSAEKAVNDYQKSSIGLESHPFFQNRDPLGNAFEWSHILAAFLNPILAMQSKNIVAMTRKINTWMLCFETIAKVIATNYPEIDVEINSTVRVIPEHPDVAEALYYRIRFYESPDCHFEFKRFFNLLQDEHKFLAPRVSDKYLICKAFIEIMDLVRLGRVNEAPEDLNQRFEALFHLQDSDLLDGVPSENEETLQSYKTTTESDQKPTDSFNTFIESFDPDVAKGSPIVFSKKKKSECDLNTEHNNENSDRNINKLSTPRALWT